MLIYMSIVDLSTLLASREFGVALLAMPDLINEIDCESWLMLSDRSSGPAAALRSTLQ